MNGHVTKRRSFKDDVKQIHKIGDVKIVCFLTINIFKEEFIFYNTTLKNINLHQLKTILIVDSVFHKCFKNVKRTLLLLNLVIIFYSLQNILFYFLPGVKCAKILLDVTILTSKNNFKYSKKLIFISFYSFPILN